jgi:Na+/proline symporter
MKRDEDKTHKLTLYTILGGIFSQLQTRLAQKSILMRAMPAIPLLLLFF